MRKIIKIFIKIMSILLIMITLGFFSIFLTNLIPSNNIKTNSYLDVYNSKKEYYELELHLYENTLLDNYIDEIIIETSVYDGNTPLNRSIYNYNFRNGNYAYVGLTNYFDNKEISKEEYPRYWHGYQVPLKLLLNIFSISDIKMLNYIMQVLLIINICILLIKNKLKVYVIPFILSISLMMPMIIFKSLTFSIPFDLMLLSSNFIIIKYKKIKLENYKYIFLIIGALTSYFDLLTFPLITIGYPIIFLLLLSKSNYKDLIKKIICYSIFWIIGYIFMWAGKWAISSILLHKNMFADAYHNILIRLNNEAYGYKIGYKNIIKANLRYIKNTFTYIILSLDLIYTFVILIINKNNLKFKNIFSLKNLNKILPFILTSLMPIVWYFTLKNHSYIHAFFTFRILSILFFSVFIILIKIWRTNENFI